MTVRWPRRAALAGLAAGVGARAVPGAGKAEPAPPGQVTLALENVSLFDGVAAQVTVGATVLIAGEHIEAVLDRPTPLPEGTPVVDGTGLTLLPGLIDAHVHWQPWMSPLFLRFGVTTVRDVGSAGGRALFERDRERSGAVVGPRMVVYGPLLDGFPPSSSALGHRALRTSEEATEDAGTLIEQQGVDGLKVYANLPPELVGAVMEVARAHGLPVAGHLGVTNAREAAALGIRSVEHLYAVAVRETPETSPSLAPFFVDRGVFASPTLLMQTNQSRLAEVGNADYPHLDLVPRQTAAVWLNWHWDPLERDPESARQRALGVAYRVDFLRQLSELGGRVVTGSDAGAPWVIPGYSLHEELALLVQAGLSPMDAVRAATGIAAQLLGRQDLGVIAPGKLADLVLVEGDPTQHISATRNIRLVLKGGTVVHDARALT